MPRPPRRLLVLLGASLLLLADGLPARAQVPANQPPVIAPIPDRVVAVGELVLFSVNATDPDGDRVRLDAANLPLGSRFLVDGNGNGSFTWRPGDDQGGLFVVSFIATDNGTPIEMTILDVAISVDDGNLPPVLEPVGDLQATVGETLQVLFEAQDPNGDPLSFSVLPVLDGSALFAGADPDTALFEFTPDRSQVGNHELTVVASDGRLTAEERIVVTVGDVNVPPFLEPIGDRQVDAGSPLEIILVATDANADPLFFEAEGLPTGAMLEDGGDGTATITWMPAAPGLHFVTVRVTDAGTPPESAEETFAIEVLAPPVVEDLILLDAGWAAGEHEVQVLGQGALPGDVVEIVDSITGDYLGSLRADGSGFFFGDIPSVVVPCAVRARTPGDESEPRDVDGAPKTCSGEPSGRIRLAFWSCGREQLVAYGSRAPARAIVRVYDYYSGELFGETRAARGGAFFLSAPVAVAPRLVRLGLELGGVERSAPGAALVRMPRPCWRR